ncbi:MAG: hypothetical protein NXI01_03440 [Gammaproteobacteria bacterium]|nr:hypothetical protein [Gammaproteobacteria bacterium]
MPGSTIPLSKILIHLPKNLREAIQRDIDKKSVTFINMMTKRVYGMLQKHYATKKLAPEEQERLKFLTEQNQAQQDRATALENTVKGSADGAPMGGGAAVNLLSTIAGGARRAQLNREESNRQNEASKKQWQATQILHFLGVDPSDYKEISEKVATTLCDELPFVLFRANDGIDGVMVIIDFLMTSMKSYAIEKLPQNDQDIPSIVAALVDAAIPPPTDHLKYGNVMPRPTIGNTGLRLHWHKTVALSRKNTEIVKLCGPAVRAFLGGDNHVDPKTGKIVSHGAFTLVGLFCHAPSMNELGEVTRGLETESRRREKLGDNKYPMHIHRSGTPRNLEFMEADRGEELDLQHWEFIRRMNLDRPSTANLLQPPTTLTKLHATSCRINENDEVPWGPDRERALQEMLQKAQAVGQAGSTVEDSIVTIKDYNRLLVEQVMFHKLGTEKAMQDANAAAEEALQARVTATGSTNNQTYAKNRDQLRAVNAARIAIATANTLLRSADEGHLLLEEVQYTTTAIRTIEAAKTTLDVARRLPIDDTHDYQIVITASQRATQAYDKVSTLETALQVSFQLVVDVVEQSQSFFPRGKQFYTSEKRNLAKTVATIKSRAEAAVDASLKLVQHADLIATYRRKDEQDSMTSEFHSTAIAVYKDEQDGEELYGRLERHDSTVIADHRQRNEAKFNDATKALRTVLDTADASTVSAEIMIIINLCVLVTEKTYELMCTTLNPDNDDINNLPENKKKALSTASTAKNLAVEKRDAAKAYIDNLGVWTKTTAKYATINEPLIPLMHAAIGAKEEIRTLIDSVTYSGTTLSGNTELLAMTEEIDRFFKNAQLAAEQGRLHAIVNQKETMQTRRNIAVSSELQEKLAAVDTAAGYLNLATKIKQAQLAQKAYKEIKEANNELLYEHQSLGSFLAHARKITRLHKEVEKRVTDDIEMTDFQLHQTRLAIGRMEKTQVVIEEMLDNLQTLQTNCYGKNNDSDTATIFEEENLPDEASEQLIMPSKNGLQSLKYVFENWDPEEGKPLSFEAVPGYEAMIGNKLREIMLIFQETINNVNAMPQVKPPMPISASSVADIPAPKKPEMQPPSSNATVELTPPEHNVTQLLDPNTVDGHKAGKEAPQPPASSAADLSPQEKDVMQSLDSNIADIWAAFQTKILENLSIIEKEAGNSSGVGDNWGIWLVVDTIVWVMRETQLMQGIDFQVEQAKQELTIIREVASKESPELKVARTSTIRDLNQAYVNLALIRKKTAKIARDPDNQEKLPLGLVPAILNWSGRLNSEELKWRLKEKAGEPPLADTVFGLLAYYNFFRFYIENRIDEVMNAVNDLSQFKIVLKVISAQHNALSNKFIPSSQTAAIDETELEELTASCQRLSNIVETELKEATGLERFRNKIVKQELAPFFMQWKENYWKRRAKPAIDYSTSEDSDQEEDRTDKSEAKTYSIAQIEKLLGILQKRLKTLCPAAIPPTPHRNRGNVSASGATDSGGKTLERKPSALVMSSSFSQAPDILNERKTNTSGRRLSLTTSH